MPKLTPSEARAEALFIVVQAMLDHMPEKKREQIVRASHREGADLGLYLVEQEICHLLSCPAEHSLRREDDILAGRRER